METIPVVDAARMLDSLVSLAFVAIRDPGRTMETAVHELHRVIACDAVLVHLGGNTPWWASSDDLRIVVPRPQDPEGWVEHLAGRPIVAGRSPAEDRVTPAAFSDVVRPPAFRGTRMFDELWRPTEARYRLSIAMRISADRMIDIGFTRSSRDFDERDRTVLALMRPEIARILSDAMALDALAQHGLTTREKEVLMLLATGRSNGQIAQELFLSAGTVRKHLEHVYAKLNVHSRTEAAAIVRRAALTTAR